MNSKQIDANYRQSLSDLLNKFSTFCDQKDSFLEADGQRSEEFISLTKQLFDSNKRLVNENVSQKSGKYVVKTSLNELHTTGFDGEQVWQQLQLQNQPIVDKLVLKVAQLSASTTPLQLQLKTITNDNQLIAKTSQQQKSRSKSVDNNQNNDIFSEESESDLSEEDDEEDNHKKKNEKKVKMAVKVMPKSVVDDVFFNLHEMHAFLDTEDLKEEKQMSGNTDKKNDGSDDDEEEVEEDIDYFKESDDDEEEDDDMNGREAMFNDFFDPPIGETVDQNRGEDANEDESSDEDEEEGDGDIDTRDVDIDELKRLDNHSEKDIDIALNQSSSSDSEDEPFYKKPGKPMNESNDNKSEFEKMQVMLNEKIAKQERLNMLEKSWQMKGEIAADKRPENSLLEEHLHFEHTSRPAPLITEETTTKLEDIIKQRVKDNSFDDVVRKVKPKEKPFEYKRRLAMDSEKSKQSLSQIYENEFLKQQSKEKEEEENAEHKEIKKQMRQLFVQLDALSSFHFTPRPVQPDIKIINNMPAITVEEVTPLATSEVSLLAPQEVFNNQKRELQTSSEKSQTDRKRDRRSKKSIQHKKSKYNESKQNIIKKKSPKDSSIISSADVKHLSSSKAFFDKLQEKTTQLIDKKKSQKNVKNKIQKHSNELKL